MEKFIELGKTFGLAGAELPSFVGNVERKNARRNEERRRRERKENEKSTLSHQYFLEYFRANYTILPHLKKHATANLCLGLAKSTRSHF